VLQAALVQFREGHLCMADAGGNVRHDGAAARIQVVVGVVVGMNRCLSNPPISDDMSRLALMFAVAVASLNFCTSGSFGMSVLL
jgi:hypothetical protein